MDAHWLELAERLSRRTYPPATVRLPGARSARDIAYHEAAHAVLLELTDRPCIGATINATVAGGGWLGAAWTTDDRTCRPPALAPLSAPLFIEERARLCCWAACSFAGRQAEYLRVGLDPGGWLDENAYDDEQARFYLSLAFGITHSSAPYAGCQALARRMLQAHWRSVRAIAMLLLVRRTIDRRQILATLNSFGAPGTGGRKTVPAEGFAPRVLSSLIPPAWPSRDEGQPFSRSRNGRNVDRARSHHTPHAEQLAAGC